MGLFRNITIKYFLLYLIGICGIIVGIAILFDLNWYVTIALFFILTIVLGFFINPFNIVLFLMFIRPLIDPFSNVYFTPNINLLGFFSVIYILFAISLILTKEGFVIFHKNILFLYFFLLIACSSLLISIDTVSSFFYILRFSSLLSIYLIIFNLIKTKEDAIRVLKCIVASSFIPLLYGFYQYFSGQFHIDPTGLPRYNSTFLHPNSYAFYLIIVIFSISCLFFLLERRKERIIWFLFLFPVLPAFLLTYTRGAWIGLLLGITLVAFLNKKVRLPLFIFSIIFVIAFLPNVLMRIDDLRNPPRYGINSWETRLNLWQDFNKAFAKRPLLGYGVGSSFLVAKKYTGYYITPHNDYLRLLIEIGVLGLIPYIVFLIFNFWDFIIKIVGKVNKEINISTLGLFISIITCSFAGNILYSIAIYGYFFTLLAITHKLNFLDSLQQQKINLVRGALHYESKF